MAWEDRFAALAQITERLADHLDATLEVDQLSGMEFLEQFLPDDFDRIDRSSAGIPDFPGMLRSELILYTYGDELCRDAINADAFGTSDLLRFWVWEAIERAERDNIPPVHQLWDQLIWKWVAFKTPEFRLVADHANADEDEVDLHERARRTVQLAEFARNERLRERDFDRN